MAQTTTPKQDFSTRLSAETLRQLDALVRSRRYKTRTAAIEEAINRLYRDQTEELERKREALERVAGSLAIGITPERFREAEFDRLDWEVERILGRR
jgi:Arc/MetJ-type ribon-helix-helix transcriptional regulator